MVVTIRDKEELYLKNLTENMREYEPGKWGIAKPLNVTGIKWRIRAAFEVIIGRAGIFRWY